LSQLLFLADCHIVYWRCVFPRECVIGRTTAKILNISKRTGIHLVTKNTWGTVIGLVWRLFTWPSYYFYYYYF